MNPLMKLWLALGLVMLAPACTKTITVPGPIVEVKVPVPVACEIEQVPQSTLPSTEAEKQDGTFDLTKYALADRQVLIGENSRLRAANSNPCPGAPQ
nr:hypothetical protein [uncultured Sphingomonas sp.]